MTKKLACDNKLTINQKIKDLGIYKRLTHKRLMNSMPAGNSTYKKLAVQWLNESLCFVSSSVVADSFVLRNRQLLVAANRYLQA